MTHEEQQALFDTILRRANLPGSFNVENGIRLTSLSDGGAEGEVRLTAGHLNPWASSTAACTAPCWTRWPAPPPAPGAAAALR